MSPYVVLERDLLRRMLAACASFVDPKAQKPGMAYVRIDLTNEEIRMQATNGHFVCRWTEPVRAESAGEPKSWLLASHAVDNVVGALREDRRTVDVCLGLSGEAPQGRCVFQLGSREFSELPYELGNYPKFDRLWPKTIEDRMAPGLSPTLLKRVAQAFLLAHPRVKDQPDPHGLFFRATGDDWNGVLVTSSGSRLVALVMPVRAEEQRP